MERVIRVLFYILEELKVMKDDGRERPVNWMIMHTISSCQIAKLYAIKEGIDPELAALTAVLHDVGVMYTKKVENHAKNAEPYVREIIRKFNSDFGSDLPAITKDNEERIVSAIICHSQKAIDSGDPLTELLKNIDSLERYLNGLSPEENQIRRTKECFSKIGVSNISK